ncbi:MAG: BNR-repeat neuraminidase N-terminal domain-containing protein [Bacteroidales bacterium]
MRRVLIVFMFFVVTLSSYSNNLSDTVRVKLAQIPILVERSDNPLLYIRIESNSNERVNSVSLSLNGDVRLKDIKSVKLYYSGTESAKRNGELHFYPTEYMKKDLPSMNRSANRSYSVELDRINSPKSKDLTLECDQPLFPGINYFWVSIEMNKKSSLLTTIEPRVESIVLNNRAAFVTYVETVNSVSRLGVGVRHAGDAGATAFRIPGLVTTNSGTLLAVYDVRYNSSVDLQEHIEVGLSRSIDKGQTWEPMRTVMSFGNHGAMPSAQNGVGDPAILVDKNSGVIWTVAAWTHGMGNQMAWFGSQQGIDKYKTAQLVLSKSEDDGKTWSEPINITEQVKDSSWYFLLQAPGMGITMDNGALVFPIQFIDSTKVPNAGIMYSMDGGKVWHIDGFAHTNTTESQVIELEPGVLMLNMRDNRGGSRAVYITSDMGKTWEPHVSNRSALNEPVCMASLIKIKAEENDLNRDIFLFSNPNTIKGRHSITIKASLDGGITWSKENQLLLDEGNGWGYSCLTLIDRATVGIIYEGSQAHMVYQRIALKDIIK